MVGQNEVGETDNLGGRREQGTEDWPLSPRTSRSAQSGVTVPQVRRPGQADATRRHQHFNPGPLTVVSLIEREFGAACSVILQNTNPQRTQ